MESKNYKKYINKKNECFSFKKFISKLFSKTLCLIIVFLAMLIVLKIDKNHNKIIYNYLTAHNINFSSINNTVKKYMGDIFPGVKEDTVPVFNEKISYENIEKYQDGAKLTVADNYLIPVIDSGIVVFSGDKDGLGKTIIIQEANGLLVWYGNLLTENFDIYDYVNKGELLGEADKNTLYLVFQKDDKYLNYEDYLK